MNGRAYLFNSVINITCGPAVQRELITGSHAVADIYCANCKTVLGWKYEKAYEENQRYKEGKFIIELAHVIRENRHLELDKGELLFRSNRSRPAGETGRSASGYKHMQQTRAGCNDWQDCSGSLASPTSSSPSTISPTSPSRWPILNSGSPVENLLDEDEELMFPFYEELCADRSSYPSSLISSHHHRMRRSLYLDSTPYDWKFSARSDATSSNDQDSPSPDLDVQDTLCKLENVPVADRNLDEPDQSSSCISRKIDRDSSETDQLENDNETQFKFEADRADQATNLSDEDFDANIEARNNTNQSNSLERTAQEESGITFSATSTGYSERSKQASVTNYMGIDCEDEEFFDCYSDHDILNS